MLQRETRVVLALLINVTLTFSKTNDKIPTFPFNWSSILPQDFWKYLSVNEWISYFISIGSIRNWHIARKNKIVWLKKGFGWSRALFTYFRQHFWEEKSLKCGNIGTILLLHIEKFSWINGTSGMFWHIAEFSIVSSMGNGLFTHKLWILWSAMFNNLSSILSVHMVPRMSPSVGI